MTDLNVEIGDSVTFTKTVSESDVYLFAGITGDFSPNHVDAEYMRGSVYGERIAHGVLSIALSSTASTLMQAKSGLPCVSYGYDRVRFIKPVLFNDTLTVTYTVKRRDDEHSKVFSDIQVTNQRGELCTVATHILKFL
jgi:3-hydroxybutyryl-CoA dehydratase